LTQSVARSATDSQSGSTISEAELLSDLVGAGRPFFTTIVSVVTGLFVALWAADDVELFEWGVVRYMRAVMSTIRANRKCPISGSAFALGAKPR
jgi:hypothetical protein